MASAAPRDEAASWRFLADLASGGAACAVATSSVAPLERVKLVLQVQDVAPAVPSSPARYGGLRASLRRLAAEQGALSLWRGNAAGVARYFPAQALVFASRDSYARLFAGAGAGGDAWARLAVNVAAGGAAGATALAVVYPLDFARTRLAADVGSPRAFRGLSDCLTKVAAADGLGGLWRGFSVSLAGVVVYRAAFFGGYEAAKGALLSRDSPLAATWAVAQAVTTGAYRAVEYIKQNMNLDKTEADIEDSKTVVRICTEYAQNGMWNIFIALMTITLAFALFDPNFFVAYLVSIAIFGLFLRFSSRSGRRAPSSVGTSFFATISSLDPRRLVVAVCPRRCCAKRASRSTAEPK